MSLERNSANESDYRRDNVSKPVLLITGAGGEIGHGLIEHLIYAGEVEIVTLDLNGLPAETAAHTRASITGDVLDRELVSRLFSEHAIEGVIHLAAMLSSSGERNPERAFDVNVNGTMVLLAEARRAAERIERDVTFIFPSTIAVYGLPSREEKESAGAVSEDDYLRPVTMYGVNKLACEHLGRYYTDHYGALVENLSPFGIDFRGLRFPGLISSQTVPSGGTSDYVPEMLHAVANGRPYACFARPDTRIPFMTMPDAIRSILELYKAPASNLSRRVYNVGAFAPTADEVASLLRESYPDAEVTYNVDQRRQRFLDTWPADVDDSAARQDWGYRPEHTLRPAFEDYLLPALGRKEPTE